ncbi:hypothetical protein GCM10027589_21610 [Actinocorallia lasiicapitis]
MRGHRHRVVVAAGVVAIVAAVGVPGLLDGADLGGQPSELSTRDLTRMPKPTGQEPTEAALASWAAFRADRAPRPIIAIGSLPVLIGGTTGNHKAALADSAFALTGALPGTAPPTLAVRLPGGSGHDYPAISARSAFDAMAEPADPGTGTDPVEITGAELGSVPLVTDRGRVTMPAWIFTVAGGGAIGWPAIVPEAFWELGRTQEASDAAMLARPDPAARTLTITMRVPPDGCAADTHWVFDPVVLESGSAVAVGLRARADGVNPGPPSACMRGLETRFAPIRFRLAGPLGERVLVYADGSPIIVKGPRS